MKEKRYTTTVNLAPPSYQISVDSWEEAEEQAAELLQRCICEQDRGTTTIIISPLKRTKAYCQLQGSR